MKLNFLAASLLFGFATYAQESTTIKGYVYDVQNNAPLGYATVLLQNTEFGAETDDNGYFEIECTEGTYTLEASYFGYQTFVMPCETTQPQELFINLISEEADLEEDRKSTRLNSSHVRISY